MSINGHVFGNGEGIVQENVEHTIKNIGYVGRVGMKSTDIEILNIMLHENLVNEKSDENEKS